MRGLFAKLENPAVTGLTAKFSDAKADMTPAAIPDLYRDEPLVLAARLDKLAGSVEIKGRIGDRPWVVTLPLANAAEGKGLSKLWARRKIDRCRDRPHHAGERRPTTPTRPSWRWRWSISS